MPVIIPKNLPATSVLEGENIFVMNEKRAKSQDIRPLKIALVNLMPTKIETEIQLLRLISNVPLQIEIDFIHTKSHYATHVSEDHLISFYKTIDDIKENKYDGMIITGAPIEQMSFEDVDYWTELKDIMEFSKKNVTSTLHICWGAQAALYYHYGINKYLLKEKMFGVFSHNVVDKKCKLVRGFDDEFYAPHSRHTGIKKEEVEKAKDINIIAESEEAGVYLMVSKNEKQIFVMGHSEYDPFTLKKEYDRDTLKGLSIKVPKNYFKEDNPKFDPIVKWRSGANLLFSNWLNYYVYQETPYDL